MDTKSRLVPLVALSGCLVDCVRATDDPLKELYPHLLGVAAIVLHHKPSQLKERLL
ncbi:MAG: hypothetical protein H6714_05075 [Myxococcales bacterium]|nr:hypothetical protein [Myxococcales bacterium]